MNMQKQKPIWSKILAMLCALALCISMVPAASAARVPATSNVTQVTMTVPEQDSNNFTLLDSDFYNMYTDLNDDDQKNGDDIYAVTGYQYAWNTKTSIQFKGLNNVNLPKNITFYAKADYQPVISAGEGSPVTVTVSPVTGNNTYNWVITVSFGEASGEVNLTVTPGQPKTYDVTFAEGDYSVTVTEATATGSGKSYTATEGTDVTFTLTPNNGFTITQVVANETTILKANGNGVYTISNIQENKRIAVTTEQTTYSIAFNEKSGEKHYTLIQGASPVAHGDSYTFSVIPEEGYDAPTVMVGNETLEPNNYAYTIDNITENKTITITDGTVQQRTVTFTSGEGYSFEGANNTTISNDKATVNYGGSVSFKVVLGGMYNQSADSVKVYANGIEIESTNGVYTINNIKVNQTVSVTGVAINTYQVTLPTDWTGYTISTVDGTSVPAGGTFTFTVTPAAGYTITKVTADDQELTSENNQYSITVNHNTTIAVTATATQYTVDVSATNATVSLGSTVSYGNNTFTVTPDAGYKVDSVIYNGATLPKSENGQYTISVTGNVNIVVTTSPLVNVTLTTTVTATGDTTYTIVVKTFPGEVTGDSAGISVVGYGTLYSNQSFSSQSLKDAILGLTLNDTLTQQKVSYVPVVYSYSKKADFTLDELMNTFSYTFNNSSSKDRYGAGWIKLSDGQNSWIVFSDAVHCQ